MRTYKSYGAALGFGSNQEALDILPILFEACECGVDGIWTEPKDLGCYAWSFSSLCKVCEGPVHDEDYVESFLCREAAVCLK